MADILARDLCVYFPLDHAVASGFSPDAAPSTLISTGKRRHHIKALHELNFHFQEGDRIGLIGRNGSGKSTLLRVLGGIYSPTGGYLEMQGHISSLFNINLGTQPDASGRENIVIRCLLKGMRHREIKRVMDDIIAFSELENFIDMPIRTYSDGMRMRLLFAIATSFQPEILLLDEWIGAGDEGFQRKAAERMNGLVDQAGITVVASHNRNLLRRICSHALWLDMGVMQAFGPIEEVFAAVDANQPAA